MFNNVALDVVIGLVFIYLLYSLLATIIQEIVATNIGLRGYILEKAIKKMLDDSIEPGLKKLSAEFYDHPLIKYLADDTWPLKRKPSYIDNETFSKVIIDLLRGKNILPGTSDRLLIQQSLSGKKTLWNPDVNIEKETLLYLQSIWTDAQGDVQKFKANLEHWFDEMMDRTTGWYKKYTQVILLVIGLSVAITFNVDTVKIIGQLERDPKLREQVIAQATDFTKAHPNLDKQLNDTQLKLQQILASANKNSPAADSLKKELATTETAKKFSDSLYTAATKLVGTDIKKLNNLLGMGWPEGSFCKNFATITFTSIIGWLLTALAISMGAPFWFDLLNKLMQLRGSKAPADNAKAKSAADDGTKKTGRVG